MVDRVLVLFTFLSLFSFCILVVGRGGRFTNYKNCAILSLRLIAIEASYTKTKRTDICFACELDDMFSGFNTVRVIAKTTQHPWVRK